ncbi:MULTISPECIES: hypothetical protein [unclassified Tolypothrix]|uniref:hypothetical protein n=1 Tax=unclassified Tolypothrix TaxID=2649714 RepID=UPI0005EAAD34|nr:MULTISPECIES: hypothetical protein [unclassified Tolypothrix]BAY88487.1 hypothetical protein NIES3275_04620 [Microchaete diplosiphon NIES-3275]EKF02435.1 hypothetical protein FDUTEX481_06841 [Tolypothrix sp. PCC 7601]MBE9084519.1 hypothetical protein [Tolypothrix sp. LEGE 11397]UYD29166.1 hypothetical protein HGR01_14665 [Tolypothrix sp. PCC 7712]UYD34921.1 hypothetical protein HG267_03670 [Tolypothrix sp. PCC 7601]
MASKNFLFSKFALFITTLISCNFSSATVKATCPTLLLDGDFEQQASPTLNSPWEAEGQVGVDREIGNSNSGKNNVWMRNFSGWNGISQRVKLQPNAEYELKAYVRTSGNVTDGEFGVRDSNKNSLVELKFGSLSQYIPLTIKFVTGNESEYNIFTGYWAVSQDSWVQVDNYSLTATMCKDEENN